MSGLEQVVQFCVVEFGKESIQIVADIFLGIASFDFCDFREIVATNFAGF